MKNIYFQNPCYQLTNIHHAKSDGPVVNGNKFWKKRKRTSSAWKFIKKYAENNTNFQKCIKCQLRFSIYSSTSTLHIFLGTPKKILNDDTQNGFGFNEYLFNSTPQPDQLGKDRLKKVLALWVVRFQLRLSFWSNMNWRNFDMPSMFSFKSQVNSPFSTVCSIYKSNFVSRWILYWGRWGNKLVWLQTHSLHKTFAVM